MKILSVIFFVAASLFLVTGILDCCGKIKNTKIKNSGIWLIITAVLMAVCGIIVLSDSPFALIYIVGGAVLINVVRCFSANEGGNKN
ncbi:MAG: hypothetical protein U0M02_14035 [Acutalibacteraceae bacterium]|nr:hypothetical protein [Acutalibacteraceae bacterium]